nr:uncharacterized protein LOC123281552 [Equus asinus]XP_044616866.1 uncharacterized protein LOC123281552 [Equus asinus]XP_044620044.1 uncharacterized protein LOC123282627 [Equus asinus]
MIIGIPPCLALWHSLSTMPVDVRSWVICLTRLFPGFERNGRLCLRHANLLLQKPTIRMGQEFIWRNRGKGTSATPLQPDTPEMPQGTTKQMVVGEKDVYVGLKEDRQEREREQSYMPITGRGLPPDTVGRKQYRVC